MKKLVVSFSGGETSAFMAQWLWQNKKLDYEKLFRYKPAFRGCLQI